MKELKVTNLSKLYCILLLSQRPQHGYELMKEIEKQLGKPVSPGQMYPFLAQLEKQGHLTVREEGGREKKTYTLTAQGRVMVKELTERFSGILDAAIGQQVQKCAHCDCEIYRGGVEQLQKGKRLMFCCGNCAKAAR